MKVINRKVLTWGSAAIASGSWAYSLAVRYTDFLFAPKFEKIAIFGFMIILSCLLSAWLFLVVINSILKKTPGRKILLAAGLSILAVLFIFSFTYEPPPFPEKHLLTITPSEERNPLSEGSSVEMASLSTVTLPSQKSKRIPVSQLAITGSWQGSGNEFGIKASESTGTSVSFERFMQAGIIIEFLTGPRSGKVQIFWDGEEQILDLYSLTPAARTIHLEPHLDWRRADMTRKILVAGAFITDLFGAAIILFSIILLISQISSRQKLFVRKPGLLLMCLAVVFFPAVCGI